MIFVLLRVVSCQITPYIIHIAYAIHYALLNHLLASDFIICLFLKTVLLINPQQTKLQVSP